MPVNPTQLRPGSVGYRRSTLRNRARHSIGGGFTMRRQLVLGMGLGIGMAGCLVRSAVAAPPDDGPILEAPADATRGDVAILDEAAAAIRPATPGPPHEASRDGLPDRGTIRVEKAPPPPIAERPRGDRPSPKSLWVDGYWAWDAGPGDFAWVPGTWRIPPPGRFWVNGSWRRDDRGWYRVPGAWSARQTDRADWRTQGPPEDRPADDPGPAPGPDYFRIPGQYVPDGDGLAWRAGFWAKAQAGWDWVPADWVRQATTWGFREGHWERLPAPDLPPAADSDVQPAALTQAAPTPPLREVRRPAYESTPMPLPSLAPAPAPAPAPTYEVAPLQRPMPMPAPAPAALIGLAEQLAGQADQFVRTISGAAGIINGAGGFMADGQRIRNAALRLRQAAAAGDPGGTAQELRNVDAGWQSLSVRLDRVSGPRLRAGIVGPFAARALQIGSTVAQLQNASR